MFRALVLVGLFAFAEDKPKEKEPEFAVQTGHFEKNNSGLKGDSSFLMMKDFDAFEKVFGTVPPLMGGGRKGNPVKKETFEKNLVAVVIKRGTSVTTYTEVGAKVDGETLTVTYKSEAGAASAATFASPLIVAVPTGKISKVVFVENGKEAGEAK